LLLIGHHGGPIRIASHLEAIDPSGEVLEHIGTAAKLLRASRATAKGCGHYMVQDRVG
jgi:hypothetical protein